VALHGPDLPAGLALTAEHTEVVSQQHGGCYLSLLCCALRDGDWLLGCLSCCRRGKGNRAAAAEEGLAFLRALHDAFVYQLFASQLPPIPQTPSVCSDASAAAGTAASPVDAALAALAPPADARAAAAVSLGFALEAKLVAWSERHPSRPSLFQRSGAASGGEPAGARGFELEAGLQQLSLHQSVLLEQLRSMQQQS